MASKSNRTAAEAFAESAASVEKVQAEIARRDALKRIVDLETVLNQDPSGMDYVLLVQPKRGGRRPNGEVLNGSEVREMLAGYAQKVAADAGVSLTLVDHSAKAEEVPAAE